MQLLGNHSVRIRPIRNKEFTTVTQRPACDLNLAIILFVSFGITNSADTDRTVKAAVRAAVLKQQTEESFGKTSTYP
jgi:hypothetical protein